MGTLNPTTKADITKLEPSVVQVKREREREQAWQGRDIHSTSYSGSMAYLLDD